MGNIHSLPMNAIAIKASQIIEGYLSLDRIPNTLTGKDADTIDGINSDAFFQLLTVAQFMAPEPTGTFEYPGVATNGNLEECTAADTLGEYFDVDWGALAPIKEFRQIGYEGAAMEGNLAKIQHWKDGAWVDNTLNIPNEFTHNWSDWVTLTEPVMTSKIRFVCTGLDAATKLYMVCQIEMRG